MIERTSAKFLSDPAVPNRLPIHFYISHWLMGLIAIQVLKVARTESDNLIPLFFVMTIGVLISYLIQWRGVSTAQQTAFVGLDIAFGLIAMTSQPFLNARIGLATEPGFEVMISTSLTWYIVLRSCVMVSAGALLWQNVPTLALFGLISTYLMSAQLTTLFACFLGLLLYSLTLLNTLSHARGERTLLAKFNLHALRGSSLGLAAAGLFSLMIAPPLQTFVGYYVMQVALGINLNSPSSRNSSNSAYRDSTEVGVGPSSLSDRPILRVQMDPPVYLRERTFDTYTGTGWQTRSGFPQLLRMRYNRWVSLEEFLETPPLSAGSLVSQRITILNDWHGFVYTGANPIRLRLPAQRLMVDDFNDTLRYYQGLAAGMQYEAISNEVPATPALRNASNNFPNWALAYYTTLPQQRWERIRNTAYEIARSRSNQYDRVIALKQFVEKQCAYNLNAEAYPRDRDVVDYFLFESKEGYCDAFATSLAVMCRYVGIPARVATGFLPRFQDKETGDYILREADRHMWTEVYFPDYGWIAFDATEGARVIDNGLTENGEIVQGSAASKENMQKRLLLYGINLLLLTAVMYLFFSEILPRIRYWHVRRLPEGQIAWLYQRLAHTLAMAGVAAPAPAATPYEYWQTAQTQLGEQHSAIQNAAERFINLLVLTRYAPGAMTKENLQQLRDSLHQAQRAVAQEVPFWQRIRRGILQWRNLTR